MLFALGSVGLGNLLFQELFYILFVVLELYAGFRSILTESSCWCMCLRFYRIVLAGSLAFRTRK